MTQARATRHHVRDVIAGEFSELVPRARLAAHQQAEDERTFLLEEEDVARLLVVHVPADDPKRGLVVSAGGRGTGAAAAPCAGLLHEPRDVVIEEGQRLFALGADRLGPGAR